MCTDPDRDAEFEFEADSSNSGATSGIVAGSVVGVLVVGGVATAAFVYYKKVAVGFVVLTYNEQFLQQCRAIINKKVETWRHHLYANAYSNAEQSSTKR